MVQWHVLLKSCSKQFVALRIDAVADCVFVSCLSAADASTAADDGDDDDVMFVFENTPTREQERRADELRLPRCFFLYESAASPCAGCIGCEPDDFDFATIGRASGE